MTWHNWGWVEQIPEGARWLFGLFIVICIVALIVYWFLFPYNMDKKLRAMHATLKSIEDTQTKLLDLELAKKNDGSAQPPLRTSHGVGENPFLKR